jgi:hypothetical protein
MKNIYLILVFLLFGYLSIAQKVKQKGNTIYVDKKEFVKIEKDDVIPGSFYITNLKGEKLIYVKAQGYIDPNYVSKGNVTGRIGYGEICNADGDTIWFEYSATKKRMCKLFYKEGIITADGALDKDKLDKLAKKIGKPYSRRRLELRY